MTRLFGFECEIAEGASDVLASLHSARLIPSARLHSYHCACEDCSHDPDRPNPLTAQEDCTVDGEVISKPLVYGSDEADRTIAGMAGALASGRGRPGDEAGFHVHVSHEDMSDGEKVLLYRMFLRYQDDLAALASGQFGAVRDYNRPLAVEHLFSSYARYRTDYCDHGMHTRDELVAFGCATPRHDSYYADDPRGRTYYCPGHRVEIAPARPESDFWTCDPDDVAVSMCWPGKDSWLARRDNTFEFRLWNSTRAEWRMRLAIGVSVAMVEAAQAGTAVTSDDPRSLVGVLTPHLDTDTLAGLIRQAFWMEEVR